MKTKCIVCLVMLAIVAVPVHAQDWDYLEENWDDLDGWVDKDHNGGVSEIDPAGQLHLDCRAVTGDGYARREQDIGDLGGDYYVEIKFKTDTWDGYTNNEDVRGILLGLEGATQQFYCFIGNDFPGGDGIWLRDGDSYVYDFAYDHEGNWDNNWHTIVFYIHNDQTDCDIWVNKDPRTETADTTDADCSYDTVENGRVRMSAVGSIAGDGEYHVDYLYIGSFLPVPVDNESPIADAGDDLVADVGEMVTLDADASYDPNGEIVLYTWKSLPDEEIIYSGSESTYQTRALGMVEEIIELTVMDNYGATASDTLRIINRTVQNLQSQIDAEIPVLQSQMEELQQQNQELQQQNQELQALVNKIITFPGVREWLKKLNF